MVEISLRLYNYTYYREYVLCDSHLLGKYKYTEQSIIVEKGVEGFLRPLTSAPSPRL